MNSYLTDDFIACFAQLPPDIQQKARKNYQLWRKNPYHRSLQFKRIHSQEALYSVRIGMGWRALGLLENDDIHWFWIGSHAEYNHLLKQF